mmetsp:Transcript_8970/g.23117  ORF Transcript_8970/g.23117 Transcript_8970/m.23117 type:complete len:358 (-) Transcript_8970:134-1207(-)
MLLLDPCLPDLPKTLSGALAVDPMLLVLPILLEDPSRDLGPSVKVDRSLMEESWFTDTGVPAPALARSGLSAILADLLMGFSFFALMSAASSFTGTAAAATDALVDLTGGMSFFFGGGGTSAPVTLEMAPPCTFGTLGGGSTAVLGGDDESGVDATLGGGGTAGGVAETLRWDNSAARFGRDAGTSGRCGGDEAADGDTDRLRTISVSTPAAGAEAARPGGSNGGAARGGGGAPRALAGLVCLATSVGSYVTPSSRSGFRNSITARSAVNGEASSCRRKRSIPGMRSSATLRVWLRPRNFFDGSDGSESICSSVALSVNRCNSASKRRYRRKTVLASPAALCTSRTYTKCVPPSERS